MYPDDPDRVAADDRLVEQVAAGAPPTGDRVAAMLAAWRDAVAADPLPIYDRRLGEPLEYHSARLTLGLDHGDDPPHPDDYARTGWAPHPIYDELVAERDARPAVTAGEQDHSDPWRYAGDVADAPPGS